MMAKNSGVKPHTVKILYDDGSVLEVTELSKYNISIQCTAVSVDMLSLEVEAFSYVLQERF